MTDVRVLLCVAVTSCIGGEVVPAVHFVNAPPVTLVDDRRDVAQLPHALVYYNHVDFYDRALVGPIVRALSLPTPSRALGVNALDEVPDSTWFTNRIGVRDLTPDEIRNGPIGGDDGPEAHKPWTIHSTKFGGVQAGYLITDARGTKYTIKYDDVALPELVTGTQVVVNRLVWACGYNVPEDAVAYVRRDELRLAPDARVKDLLGHNTEPLDDWKLDHDLASAWHAPDGRIRVMISRWLGGNSLGGHTSRGLRPDDPNDRIPHERRRDLRGQYPIFAWLDHVDLNTGNSLDMWVSDPLDPRRHYVQHYVVDFSKSLGAMTATDHYPQEGHAYSIDYTNIARSLFTLGIAPRPRGVGGSHPRSSACRRRSSPPASIEDVASRHAVRAVRGRRPLRQLLGRAAGRAVHARADPRRRRGRSVLRPARGRIPHRHAGRTPAGDRGVLVRAGEPARRIRRRRRPRMLRRPRDRRPAGVAGDHALRRRELRRADAAARPRDGGRRAHRLDVYARRRDVGGERRLHRSSRSRPRARASRARRMSTSRAIRTPAHGG